MKLFYIALALTVISACTDAGRANFGALGSAGAIQCYSGGHLIYEGKSTGKIATVKDSDGWEFKEALTGKFIRVSGDCLIQN